MESSRETTVLFAAIIGAADMREKAGDKAAHEALERCQFRLGQAAASCGARLMKGTADKVMVLAANPDAVFVNSESSEFYQACCPEDEVQRIAAFENQRRCSPVDPLQVEEPAIEPRPQEMHEIAVDGRQCRIAGGQ